MGSISHTLHTLRMSSHTPHTENGLNSSHTPHTENELTHTPHTENGLNSSHTPHAENVNSDISIL